VTQTGVLTKVRTLRFAALGTEVLVCSPAADELAGDVRSLVEEYEERFSRFRPSSELERLSARTGEEVAVSEDLFEVLELAMGFWRETAGLFDPLVRAQLEAAGYDRSFDLVPRSRPEPAPPPTPGRRPTFGEVRLDAGRRTVRLPRGGRLDLGGIAKGWIIDRLVRRLAPYGPFLADIGGDVAVRGDGPDGGPGWLIGVTDPFRPDEDRCWVRLRDGTVATSTVMRRRWQRAGHWLHHLIDPRTGSPARTALVQATVVAPTATAADVYAKTAIILGRERAFDWLARRSLPALLVTPAEAVGTSRWHGFEVPIGVGPGRGGETCPEESRLW